MPRIQPTWLAVGVVAPPLALSKPAQAEDGLLLAAGLRSLARPRRRG